MSAGLAPRLNFSSRKKQEDDLDYSQFGSLLSEFQIEKLTYFFQQFFDINGDGVISATDLPSLNERLRTVSGWSVTDPNYLTMADNNRVFFECLIDQVKAERNTEGLENRSWAEALAPRKMTPSSVTLQAWLNMWGRLCTGSAGIDDFPIWVQLIPKIMFSAITAGQGANIITRDALRDFYVVFSGLDKDKVEQVATVGFKTISANGDYEVDMDTYKLLFSNFLLGKTIYGPGKFIFGCFDNRDMTQKYKIISE